MHVEKSVGGISRALIANAYVLLATDLEQAIGPNSPETIQCPGSREGARPFTERSRYAEGKG